MEVFRRLLKKRVTVEFVVANANEKIWGLIDKFDHDVKRAENTSSIRLLKEKSLVYITSETEIQKPNYAFEPSCPGG